MIDPTKLLDYDLVNDAQLRQEFVLFAVAADCKSAAVQSKKIDAFLKDKPDAFDWTVPWDWCDPMNKIRFLGAKKVLEPHMRKHKLGKYSLLVPCFDTLSLEWGRSHRPFNRWTVKEFERFRGIGQKTSRFIVSVIDPNSRVAVLDVHIMKWLRAVGYDAPVRPTPSNYSHWELVWLEEVERRLPGTRFATVDLHIGRHYSTGTKLKKELL